MSFPVVATAALLAAAAAATATATAAATTAGASALGFTPETCADLNDRRRASTAALRVLDKATAQLARAEGAPFEDFVDGVAVLSIDNSSGVKLGGATNPNGFYVSYFFNASALPTSACARLVRGPQQGGSGEPVCHSFAHADLVEVYHTSPVPLLPALNPSAGKSTKRWRARLRWGRPDASRKNMQQPRMWAKEVWRCTHLNSAARGRRACRQEG